jgi:hypothetical protein
VREVETTREMGSWGLMYNDNNEEEERTCVCVMLDDGCWGPILPKVLKRLTFGIRKCVSGI